MYSYEGGGNELWRMQDVSPNDHIPWMVDEEAG